MIIIGLIVHIDGYCVGTGGSDFALSAAFFASSAASCAALDAAVHKMMDINPLNQLTMRNERQDI